MKRYGDVDVTIDGETYVVRYGNLAWDALKRLFGLATDGACLIRGYQVGEDRIVFLREGLATYRPDITIERTRELYDALIPDGGRGLFAAAMEAVELAMPQLKALGEESSPNAEPAAQPKSQARTRSGRKR